MDPEMATQVISQTDTMQNEPMNFRVGGELVRKLRTFLPDELTLDQEGKKYVPFFEQLLYSIPAEEFLKDVIANVISDEKSDNDKAVRKFNELLQKAKVEYKKYKEGDDDDDYGIYIPEVKYLSPEPLVNYNDLSLTTYSNVHFVGDALSARGITVSNSNNASKGNLKFGSTLI